MAQDPLKSSLPWAGVTRKPLLAGELQSSLRRLVLFPVRMRRKVQIVVSLIAMVVLITPLDCLAFGSSPSETAKCCMKGKCAPTAKADDCCRASVPDSSQSVPAARARYVSPLICLVPAQLANFFPSLHSDLQFDTVRHPPPLNRLPYTPPLLI
jgi:hypothetical protein